MKKLEARGRTAFEHGDIDAATRYFTQALEKHSNSNYSTTPEPKLRKRSMLKAKTVSIVNVNNNEDEQVWILQSTDKGKRLEYLETRQCFCLGEITCVEFPQL